MDAFKTIMETYDSLNVTFEITLYSSKREVISASTIYSHMSLNTQFLSINISLLKKYLIFIHMRQAL